MEHSAQMKSTLEADDAIQANVYKQHAKDHGTREGNVVQDKASSALARIKIGSKLAEVTAYRNEVIEKVKANLEKATQKLGTIAHDAENPNQKAATDTINEFKHMAGEALTFLEVELGAKATDIAAEIDKVSSQHAAVEARSRVQEFRKCIHTGKVSEFSFLMKKLNNTFGQLARKNRWQP